MLTDCFLAFQVWSSAKGHEVAALYSSSPLNCVAFDPEGHLLAAGCWNGNVTVWNWLQNEVLTVSYLEEKRLLPCIIQPEVTRYFFGILSTL